MSKIDDMIVCIKEIHEDFDVDFDVEKLVQSPSLVRRVVKLFNEMPDPRIIKKTKYRLCDILTMIFLAALGNCDTSVDYVYFWEDYPKEYKKIFGYDRIPSHDTFERILSLIDSYCFQDILFSSLAMIEDKIRKALGVERKGKKVIPLDGKVLKGTGDKAETSEERKDVQTLNVIDACSYSVLFSEPIDEKTNEIKHGQKVLDILNLSDAIFTCDAMNTQIETVNKIVKGKGNEYVMGLKGNQGTLRDFAEACFDDVALAAIPKEHPDRYYVKVEVAHNKVEKREYLLHILTPREKKDFKKWKKLNAILCVRKTNTDKVTQKVSVEVRYYITSLDDVKLAGDVARLHWNVEITHFYLDTVMHEDAMQVRNRNAAHNRSILNKACVSIYRYYRLLKGLDCSIKSLRKMVSRNFFAILREILTMLTEKTLVDVITITPKN